MRRIGMTAAGLLVVATVTLAESQPPFKSYYNSVNGLEPPGTPQIYFFTESYDDLSGTPVGSAAVGWWYDGVWHLIRCSGPELADAVSMNEDSGKLKVDVVLDPDAAYCDSPTNNINSPVVLNLTGKPSGGYHDSVVTTAKHWSPDGFAQTRSSHDYFTESYVGTAPVSYASYRGYAVAKRETEKRR